LIVKWFYNSKEQWETKVAHSFCGKWECTGCLPVNITVGHTCTAFKALVWVKMVIIAEDKQFTCQINFCYLQLVGFIKFWCRRVPMGE